MFNKNKYSKYYNTLISTRQGLNRRKDSNQYFEEHHIIPKSLGGDDFSSNLVLLTAREHYIAHLLLIKMVNGKHKISMVRAFVRMQKDGNYSRNYELARKIISKNHQGKLNHAFQKKWIHNLITGEIKFLNKDSIQNLDGTWCLGLPFQRGGHKKSEKIWVTRNNISKMIMPLELEIFKNNGWSIGRGQTTLNRNVPKNVSKWMNDMISKEEKVEYENIKKYQSIGWILGRLPRQRKPKEKKIWMNNFTSSKIVPVSKIQEYTNKGWLTGRLK